MIGWALRYVLVAIAAAILLAVIQGRDKAEPQARAHATARDATPQPAHTYDSGGLEHIITAGSHGHFLVEAHINGTPIDFLVDTGASEVVLNMRDAAKLGFRAGNLNFSQRFRSANGVVRAAPVTLRELRIGQLQLFDLRASVNEAPLDISLLGMSFLRRLRSYEVVAGRLILRW